ncbi:glycosyltransferase [Natrinema altunense]|uniref:Glycosyl transferase, group 1 family protein n=1 Tax=Natrinema altunense (strain JCM 12890 / CGMCC 1.3731 / AJ2) TaxID=1227494 RepID=L9ZEA2_NATA2|nr:glycosyltransferase [Natrinema altunense]ELY84361.1 glycosyl transferase, group 1 family protein [Natrinema altunense JCM 12890]
MRVLNSLADPRVGGPQLRALAVATGLRDRGIETVFHLPDGDDAFERMATDAGFEVVRPGPSQMRPPPNVRANARFAARFLPSVSRLASTIERREIDVVHASMTLAVPAAIAAWRTATPLAWFFNDTGTPWPLDRVAARLARATADEIALAADAVGDHFFDDAVPTRTVYPPVDVDALDPSSVTDKGNLREELGVADDVPIVGTVGNVNPVKGHEYLLRAIARVRDRVGPVAVPIAGKLLDSRREYADRLRRVRARLDLEGTVRFLGHRSDVPQLLAAFDVFVLPSVTEACPIAVLEAMAMESAIVATRVGGVPEQLVDGTHGWLVPPADPDALATAIREALAAPAERRRRGAAARRRATARFSTDRCVERHHDLYEAALSRSTPRPLERVRVR